MTPPTVGTSKYFAVRRGALKERLDPKFILYGGHQLLKNARTSALGNLTVREPEYGSGARAVPMASPEDVKCIRITDFGDYGDDQAGLYPALASSSAPPIPFEIVC